MKVFSSCVSFSCFNSKIGNISFDKLNSKIESAIKKNKNLGMNACHKTAIQIAFMDQGISKETKKQLAESLYDNYSELYRNLMNVGENTLSQRLATNLQESGFLNFVKEDDSLCHTAYIKHHNGNYVYYHSNYTEIDKAIVDKCGLDIMKQIKGSSITYYSMSEDSVAAIEDFMLLNKWRVSFCPVKYFE